MNGTRYFIDTNQMRLIHGFKIISNIKQPFKLLFVNIKKIIIMEEIKEKFVIGDEIIFKTLHNNFGKDKVVKTTKTQAILESGKRIPIIGVNGCQEIRNVFNKHMVHYTTYFRYPNVKIIEWAKKCGFNL
jgi:hypothetical protein